ncbi:MAG: hypothetical protein Q4P71_09080 [Actinomycetaceae bacterium]|nr:hypothetical protein [Actinomycetaceae bacterium]
MLSQSYLTDREFYQWIEPLVDQLNIKLPEFDTFTMEFDQALTHRDLNSARINDEGIYWIRDFEVTDGKTIASCVQLTTWGDNARDSDTGELFDPSTAQKIPGLIVWLKDEGTWHGVDRSPLPIGISFSDDGDDSSTVVKRLHYRGYDDFAYIVHYYSHDGLLWKTEFRAARPDDGVRAVHWTYQGMTRWDEHYKEYSQSVIYEPYYTRNVTERTYTNGVLTRESLCEYDEARYRYDGSVTHTHDRIYDPEANTITHRCLTSGAQEIVGTGPMEPTPTAVD